MGRFLLGFVVGLLVGVGASAILGQPEPEWSQRLPNAVRRAIDVGTSAAQEHERDLWSELRKRAKPSEG